MQKKNYELLYIKFVPIDVKDIISTSPQDTGDEYEGEIDWNQNSYQGADMLS